MKNLYYRIEIIWQESTQTCVNKLIPSLENKFKVDFSPISDAKDYGYNNGCFYSLAPEYIFDFIYVDGPDQTFLKYEYSICPILLKQISIDTIIFVDGISKTCNKIKKELKKIDKEWNEYAVGFPSDDTIFINRKNKKFEIMVSNFSEFILEKPNYY